MICEKCGKEFFEDWRKQKCPSKGECRFCSPHCSFSRIMNEHDKKRIKDKLQKYPDKFCPECGKKIDHMSKKCIECSRKERRDNAKWLVKSDTTNEYFRVHSNIKRKENKRWLVEQAGGKCIVCGYDKCQEALDFHHLDETTKKFGITGGIMTSNKETLLEEVKKCILLCARCHREVHVGFIDLKNVNK